MPTLVHSYLFGECPLRLPLHCLCMLFIDTLKLKSVQTVVHMSKRLIEKFKMVELKNCENLAQYDMAGISFWIYLQASI